MFDTAEPIPEKQPVMESLKVAPLAPTKNKKKQPSIYKKQATSPLNTEPKSPPVEKPKPPVAAQVKPLNKFQ